LLWKGFIGSFYLLEKQCCRSGYNSFSGVSSETMTAQMVLESEKNYRDENSCFEELGVFFLEGWGMGGGPLVKSFRSRKKLYSIPV
jgi:hypothetical protein